MPKFFGDNMVLQRNGNIPIWGWAKANEKIVVQFNKQIKTTKADKAGKWMVHLDAEKEGGPYVLKIAGKNILEIKNVLVGDVWLCTGQSNMEWTVGQSNNAKKEIAGSNYPLIRHIKIQHAINSLPDDDVKDAFWKVCDTNTVADFTGVGYFFAKNIFDNIKVPIGLINTCWGGTNIETWISREGFESSTEFKEMIAGMPKISLDSISNLRDNGSTKRIESMQETKLKNIDVLHFKDLSFDDTKWPIMNVPQVWEQQKLGEFDGIVWLRKSFILTSDDIKNGATISLAKIDDIDTTYINGIKIGTSSIWEANRNYSIENNILKEGINTIAVQVIDNGGGGGIWGESTQVNLALKNRTILLAGNWKYQVQSILKTPNQNSLPSLCYNAMIAPLIPYSFKGVLWYQGESNAKRSIQYRKAFPLLINDWRQKFMNDNAAFYFVQLATFFAGGNSNEGCGWAELREAQTQTLELKNTGMVVTTDLVTNPKDIHPTNKQDVGKRLAAIALNNLYQKKMICTGPTYKTMEIKDNKIILSFDNIGSGLQTTDKYGYIKGFEIAGADNVFHFAQAFIKQNTIVLYSEKVINPIIANYGWMGDATECNLFNKEGFPAVPFRTMEIKNATEGEKYSIEKLN
ncbi:MAG: sialate O-acetylesterase [Ferruginibacter sp.]